MRYAREGSCGVLGASPRSSSLFALAVFGPSLAIRRTARRLEPLNQYLTLVAITLVGYTAWLVSRDLVRQPAGVTPLELPAARTDHEQKGELPDIYLIVLDKYTSSELLEDHFGFDNRGFEAFLRSRGFIVPRHPRANYPRTQLALTAMLNLDYIHNLPRQRLLSDPIEHNRLTAFLKREGYRFVFFPTPFKFTSKNRYADLQLPSPREVVGEFRAAWERTTILPELIRWWLCSLGMPGRARFRLHPESAELMDWKFERMGKARRRTTADLRLRPPSAAARTVPISCRLYPPRPLLSGERWAPGGSGGHARLLG